MPLVTCPTKQASLLGTLPALNTDSSTIAFDFTEHWRQGSLSAESVHFAENLSPEDLSLFLLWYLYYDLVSAPPGSPRDWYGQLPPEVVRGMIRLGRELGEEPLERDKSGGGVDVNGGAVGKEKARLPNRMVCTCADLDVCSIDLLRRIVRFSSPNAMRFPERADIFSKRNAVEALPRCWEHEELPPVKAAKRNSQTSSATGALLRTPRAAAWEDVAEKLRKDRLTAERLTPREGGIWEAYRDAMVEKLNQFEKCVVEPALAVEYALMNGRSVRTVQESGGPSKQMRVALLQRWEEIGRERRVPLGVYKDALMSDGERHEKRKERRRAKIVSGPSASTSEDELVPTTVRKQIPPGVDDEPHNPETLAEVGNGPSVAVRDYEIAALQAEKAKLEVKMSKMNLELEEMRIEDERKRRAQEQSIQRAQVYRDAEPEQRKDSAISPKSPYTQSSQFTFDGSSNTARGQRPNNALSTTYETILDTYPERPPTGDWTRDVLTAALRNTTKETYEASSGVSVSSQYSEHNMRPNRIPQRVSSIATHDQRPHPLTREATSHPKSKLARQPSSRASASRRPGAEAYAAFAASPWNTSNTLLVPSLHHRKEAPYIHPQDNFSIHSRGGSRHVFVYKRDCHEVEGDVRFGGGVDVGSWQTRSTSPGLTEDTEFLDGARGIDGSSRDGRVDVQEREVDVPVQTGYRLSRAFVPEEVDPLEVPMEEEEAEDEEEPRAASPHEISGMLRTSLYTHADSGSRKMSAETLHERRQVVSEEDTRPILHVNVNRMGTFRSQASHDTHFSETRAGSALSMSSAQTGSTKTMSVQRLPAASKPELVHCRSAKSLKATSTTAAAGNGVLEENIPDVPGRAKSEAHYRTQRRDKKSESNGVSKSSVSTDRSHSSTPRAQKKKSDMNLRLQRLKEELQQENRALREELERRKNQVERFTTASVGEEEEEESDDESLYGTPEGSRSGTPFLMPGRYPE